MAISTLAIVLMAGKPSAVGAVPPVELVAEPDRVELATPKQKLVFARAGEEEFVLTSWVRGDQGWRILFDGERPLLQGPSFGLQPTRYAVLTNTPGKKVVEFSGRHRQPDYDWSLRLEANAGWPLFRFRILCQLPGRLPLGVPQPVVGLWMKRTSPAFHLDQGPDSIYGSAGVPHGYGFPAACLWDDGRMAAVFFNMTPMRWMRPDGVCRFNDVRIMTWAEHGQSGLGMHCKKASGPQLPPGEMIIEFYLYQESRPQKPSGLEALDTMVRVFAPLHPSDSVFPLNYLTGKPASWEQFAQQALADLMVGPEVLRELQAPWRDAPLELVPPQEKMIVHPAVPMRASDQTAPSWDFSTVNNHLSPWLLLARLGGDPAALRAALAKKDALPRFYDERSQLIRHGTRQPPHVGDLEMTWQSLFFHEEVLRAAAATAPRDFNPAVAGRFLMGTTGLRELARKADYVFPQWFDPYEKVAVIQNDVKQLGFVREPWQAGGYAHLMMRAFEMTGDREYLAEAQRAIETLMQRMRFRVQNEVYDRSYEDPSGFPITELFGNAWGIAAAYQLHEVTGEAKYLRYSRDFLNTLLRLTFWYEDETDSVSRDLRNAGLFYPHGGAHVATPWETAEAHLMIAWTLKHDRNHPLTELLLKLSNLNRINSFYFFPAAWSATMHRLDPAPRGPVGQYFPIEPFYCLEGTGGHRWPTAAYMAGLALWNGWLYEALAEATDRDVMMLNLDAMEDYEAALAAVERHFMAYNPGPANRNFRVLFKHLPEADYLLTIGSREQKNSAAELRRGVPLAMPANAHVRFTLRCSDHHQRSLEIQQQQAAQNALAYAYQVLQEQAVRRNPSGVPPQMIQDFAHAWQRFSNGHCPEARAAALRIVEQGRR